jgi:hypothetical protein
VKILRCSYICRQDVEDLGYQHFCQHFRPLGGACTICNKCGLYDKEDEEQGSFDFQSMVMVAIKEARIRATGEYLSRHPVATNAVHASVREAYLSRRANVVASSIVNGSHSGNRLI